MTTPPNGDALQGAQSELLAETPFEPDLNSVYAEPGPGCIRIHVVGEIDLTSHPQLDTVATALEASEPSDILVDLSRATFIDSTMLGFLAKLHTRVKSSGHRLTLFAPQRTVLRALTVVGFDRVMTIVEG
jgi:anti-anti-sigma factor